MKIKKVENKNVTSKYGTNGKLNHYLKWVTQLRMEKNSVIKPVGQMHRTGTVVPTGPD
jgi:hypothetical protein